MNENSTVHESNGNTVTLREYIEALIAERDKAMKEALRVLEHRLGTLNELRSEVVKDRGTFVRLDIYNAAQEQRDLRIRALEDTTASRTELIAQFRAAQADIENLQKALTAVERGAASQEAVQAFKRLIYGFAFLAIVTFGVALFNLVTKSGG